MDMPDFKDIGVVVVRGKGFRVGFGQHKEFERMRKIAYMAEAENGSWRVINGITVHNSEQAYGAVEKWLDKNIKWILPYE